MRLTTILGKSINILLVLSCLLLLWYHFMTAGIQRLSPGPILSKSSRRIKKTREEFYMFPNDCLNESVILAERKKIFPCKIGTNGKNGTNILRKQSISPSDKCYKYKVEQFLSRRVQFFYLNYDDPHEDNHGVTLVSQLSIDRFKHLELMSQQWEGPMSITLYASEAELRQFLKYVTKSLYVANRTNIGIHVVYKDGDLYPFNFLRNIAIGQVHTPYLFMIDIDFVPVSGLYQFLRKLVATTDMNKKAIVIPAFGTSLYDFDFPQKKSSLLSLIKSGKVQPVNIKRFPEGHGPTNYEKWDKALENYDVTWKPNYEPFMVVKKYGFPYFDTRFIGYGRDKTSHSMELNALRYRFIVASNAFMIHMPHNSTKGRLHYVRGGIDFWCIKGIAKAICEDLNRKYGSSFHCS